MRKQLNPLRADTCFLFAGIAVAILIAGCGGGRDGGPSVRASPQSISFSAAPTLSLHGTATVVATASSTLPVAYSSATPSVCSVHAGSGLVTDITAGVCRITANQAGNDVFAPAPAVTQTLTVVVNPSQTISFGAAPALTLYGSATVTATTTSGLAISYQSATPAICSVHSTTGVVTDIAAGVCTIAADQGGDANYNAAAQITQSIVVPVWSGPLASPGVPTGVTATLGAGASAVSVSFVGPSSSGGSPITGYTVVSTPAGVSASGSASPIAVSCPTSCAGYAFAVQASNGIGNSALSAYVDVVTNFRVTTRFYEPDTQPNDTIFTGTFTLNTTTQTVSNLAGSLTESMTGPPMVTVPLVHQLSSVSDGNGGLLVTTFALNTVNTYSEGGFAANSAGLYYGYPSAANPAAGGTGNSFVTIYVNPVNPSVALTQSQINLLSYGDCAAGGMMGDTCMTGYSGRGTMGGYPAAQSITRQ